MDPVAQTNVFHCLRDFVASADVGPQQVVQGGNGGGWEDAGSQLWNLCAEPDQALILAQTGAVETFIDLFDRWIANENWRAIEICVGIMASMVYHEPIRLQLAGNARLQGTVLDRVLWLSNAACIGEALRLATVMIGFSPEGHRNEWYQNLTTEANLGRVLWIMQHSTRPEIVDKTLALVSTMLCACGSPEAPGDALVQQMTGLGLLSLVNTMLQKNIESLRREAHGFEAHRKGDNGDGQGINNNAAAAAGAGHEAPLGTAIALEGVDDSTMLEVLSVLDSLTSLNSGAETVQGDIGLLRRLIALLELSEDEGVQVQSVTVLAALDDGASAALVTIPAVKNVIRLVGVAKDDGNEAGVIACLSLCVTWVAAGGGEVLSCFAGRYAAVLAASLGGNSEDVDIRVREFLMVLKDGLEVAIQRHGQQGEGNLVVMQRCLREIQQLQT